MELKALNEIAPAVVPYAVGTVVELDAGTGSIVDVFMAPNGETYYAIDYKLPNGEISHAARWHDEITLHPVDAAVMAIADDGKSDGALHDVATDAVASALVTGGAPSIVGMIDKFVADPLSILTPPVDHAVLDERAIDDKFKAMLDKGAAIIASIDTIKPLDLVVLKSGGPQMIVEKIDGATDLMCWWMDHTANLHVARFGRELVDLVPSAADMRDRSPMNPRNVTTGDPA